MDYEDKYKEALNRAVVAYKDEDKHLKATLERIFPELKESEDERIRKEIISALKNANHKGVYDKHLAWLEKQDKKSVNDTDDEIMNVIKDMPVPDMSKPKFREGDWVVFNNHHDSIYQVEKIENYEYTLRHIHGGSLCLSFSNEELIRDWTIKDAKDGDVLVSVDDDERRPFIYKGCLDPNHPNAPVAYCGIDTEGYICSSGYHNHWWTDENVQPATKEQRDLLFQKMKEAGYEWDAEKKKLKKVEQKPDSAWSEEDGNKVEEIIEYLNELFDNYRLDLQEINDYENWLKSLKQRIKE